MTNEDAENWTSKYRPETFGEIQGNNKDVKAVKDWADNFSPGDQPQLLVGPQGVGKTTTAYVVADYFDYPINEINASDSRKTEDIERIAPEFNTTPTTAEYQLVLFDEADSMSHKADLSELVEVLKDPRNPIIVTANDAYSMPKQIRRACKERDFSLGKRSIKSKLKKIAKEEGVRSELDDPDLDKLADRPDLRSAIQDLQAWAEDGRPADTGNRETDKEEFDAIEDLLRGKSDATENAWTPDDGIIWADQNVRKEFRGVEAMVAYQTLSDADIQLERARSEDYRFWKYAGALIEQIGNTRITEPYDGWMDIDFPSWWQDSTDSLHDGSPEAELFKKLKDHDGTSFRLGGDFPYFKNQLLPILRNLPLEERMELILHYNLESDEMEALDVTEKQYSGWHEGEVPEERVQSEAELQTQDVLSF